jgi:glycosyltransferase involved in cell wall biosynthesis
MHIVQLMFGRGLGGIEQAFIDYCDGLHGRGHRVTAIIHPGAQIKKSLLALGIEAVTLRNMGAWDYFAAWRLRSKLRALNPDVIISHSNRGMSLAHKAIKGEYKLVGVAHNYNTRRLNHADAVFAITHDLMRVLGEQGIRLERIFHIPNMVRCHGLPRRLPGGPLPLIAAMGRFVKKKGFEVFIDALAILHERGYRFQAVLGGCGEEEAALKKRAKSAGLKGILSFPGWIEDKKEFYSRADIFCLPSLHEPFGIVLLEAFMYGAPVIATDSEGPRDIITANYDALIVPKGDAAALALALASLLDNPKRAEDLAANGFAKVKTRYTIESVAEQIEKALNVIVAN